MSAKELLEKSEELESLCKGSGSEAFNHFDLEYLQFLLNSNKTKDEIIKILYSSLKRIETFEPWDVIKNPGCGSSADSQSMYKSFIAHEGLEKADSLAKEALK